ncbi:hypothetical protein AALO_G00082290 [Alosa alosa]|uniref:BZIP domain-containing protein n=1 Tax=Alosa alosa TaxID=278164 RepID=A0AAV6GY70_9TELE|nr:hypothetical protein AALO_G00082290 [Alosa alosa]
MKALGRRKRKRRSWRRIATGALHSQLSWGPHCGTRPCPTMGITSSWSIWIWRSSSQRTASQPTARVTKASSSSLLNHHSSRLCPSHQPLPTPAPNVVDLSSRAAPAVHKGLVPQNCLQSPPRSALPSARNTPSPIDPESIQVPVGYEPDPADLALSSVPGQEMFDPRKRKFSAEELKPQPMIKKARKVFIPEDLKDDRYWARRRKNNVAAKRSRDARRLKENQIAIRAGFLEKENSALRLEVADLRKELGRCKNVLAKYEARHGPL